MRRKCQEKNDNEVEKVATIFPERDRLSSLPITKDDAREATPPAIPRWHRAMHAQKFLREDFF
jgi:hypothetical protein